MEKLDGFIGKVTKVSFGIGEKVIELGGQTAPSFLKQKENPKVALLISDIGLAFPSGVTDPYLEKYDDLIEWGKFYVKNYGIDALQVKFSNETLVSDYLEELLNVINVPLIISGSSEKKKNHEIARKCSEIAEGKNLLLCSAELESYKSIAATAIAYGHCVVAESPIDVNIAKQLNILLTDLGLPLERIIIDPMVASLGYGLEYTFSIMERIRSLTFAGDVMLSSPMICFVYDVWRAREASSEYPEWGGSLVERGILWEAMTAATLYSAGADLLVFRHPLALQYFKSIFEVE